MRGSRCGGTSSGSFAGRTRAKMTSEPILNDDFRDLLAELERAAADFLVVGGFAVSAYGYQRSTKDLDVFVRPTLDNARRVLRAIGAFGAPLHETSVDDLATPGLVLQLGVAPRRIDILNQIEGVAFDEAAAHRTVAAFGSMEVPIIGRDALIKNKLAVGRPEDLKDVRKLQAIAAKGR